MKIYQDDLGWWLEPEREVDRLLVDSLSGPWANEEAVMLASYGKWSAAHDAERRGGKKDGY